MDSKIMIGCPVRDRAWILPRYLECLSKLHYPVSLLHFCFIINDCSDDTELILADFAADPRRKVTLINADFKATKTPSALRGSYSFNCLADLRNILLGQFLKSDCKYLFSVDSDILVLPHSLSCLLAANRDIISALVCNGHEINDPHCYNILNRDVNGSWQHLRQFPRDQIFQVDCTGAAILIKRKVIEKHGVCYSATYGPEDFAFCRDAVKQGLKIYCDGRIELEHVMFKDHHHMANYSINSSPTLSIK